MANVADLLIQGLLQAGTQRLFVAPDGGSAAALLQSAEAQGFPFLRVHSEFAACVMAAVSGELTGAPGAAVTGRGAMAAAPGVAHARRDRAPMIVITDDEPAASPAFTGESALDVSALYDVLAKQSQRVTADSASHWIAHAAQLSMQEPRGPVHLGLAPDVAGATALPVATPPRSLPLAPPDSAALDAAAALIEAANRPIVIAGLGCRAEDAGWVRAFAEASPAPVLTTFKAKGTMPEPHPLSLGVFTGGEPEAPIVRRADLIVAVGLDATEVEPRPWPYTAKVLHAARSAHTGECYRPAVEVIGEPGLVFEELAPRLRGKARADWDVAEVDRLKREPTWRPTAAGAGLTLERVVQITRELTEAGTIATIDGGARMLPAALRWQAVARGECLVPNRLATAGFALPAAIAAQLAHPERRVVCFTDVSGLMRVIAELETTARLTLPIVVIVLDGDGLSPADPAAIGRGFGLAAWEASDEETARRAIWSALGANRPALVQARIAAPGGYQRVAGRDTMSVRWRS